MKVSHPIAGCEALPRAQRGRSALQFMLVAGFAGVVAFSGCRSTRSLTVRGEFAPVTIEDLNNRPAKYAGRKVVVDAYILGMEYGENSDDAHVWLLALGNEPQLDERLADQLVFPRIGKKIRAAEDGYNREILTRCYDACGKVRRKGERIKAYGVFAAVDPYQQYYSGVDLQLSQIKIDGRIINTDFNDHGKLKEKTPGMLKKTYGGAKKLFGVVGKAF